MAKAAEFPLQKHTLNLYAGDMDELRRLFPDVEPTVIVRELVRNCIIGKTSLEGKPKLDVELSI